MGYITKVAIATSLAVTGSVGLLYLIYQRLGGRGEGGEEEETDAGPTVANVTKYGKPLVVQELRKPGYLILYNNQTKTPAYVVEKLTADILKDGAGTVERENMAFYSEAAIRSNVARATNADYTGSGFDRGHMAAAANHASSEDALLETFTLSNAAPQFPACNRGNWKVLENYARALAKSGAVVYVYSGPLFVPQQTSQLLERYVVYQVIGKHTVAVPTHFFKIIVVERAKQKATVECFVVENAPNVKSLVLHDMKIELADIEKWSGLVFDKLHKFV